jgi:hypothetical protein
MGLAEYRGKIPGTLVTITTDKIFAFKRLRTHVVGGEKTASASTMMT